MRAHSTRVKSLTRAVRFCPQVAFEDTYYARDSGTLEQLKQLSSSRKAIEASINGSSQLTPAIAREMAGGITSPILQVLFIFSRQNDVPCT